MRVRIHRGLLCLLLASCQQALAQQVIEGHEILSRDRPEAWAMNYRASSTLMTSFGASPLLPAGDWRLAADLVQIPHLGARERQVGFDGLKSEDLNKSPVFGRLRLAVGLPAGLVVELGYTPSVVIDGARTRDLIALAIARRLASRPAWALSGRVFGQHGSVQGDMTCPAGLAGLTDPAENPYGCEAPSADRLALNYYGADLTLGGGRGAWGWHASGGIVRTELAVQVDALTFGFRDRTRLSATGDHGYLALGGSRNFGPGWSLAAEVLHVPLSVRRDPDRSPGHDSFSGLRMQLRYRYTAGR